MTTLTRTAIADFVNACHRAAEQGLIKCSSGNMSCRLGADRMLITAKRAWLPTLTSAQVALCRIADGTALNARIPSTETPFHRAILNARPDATVVLHFQSPYATAVACLKRKPASFYVTPEMPFYVGPVAWVPYFTPGTAALADAVVQAMRKHELALLRHHGQVVLGTSFDDAIQKAVFFELACMIIIAGGARIGPMSNKQAADLLRTGYAKTAVRGV